MRHPAKVKCSRVSHAYTFVHQVLLVSCYGTRGHCHESMCFRCGDLRVTTLPFSSCWTQRRFLFSCIHTKRRCNKGRIARRLCCVGVRLQRHVTGSRSLTRTALNFRRQVQDFQVCGQSHHYLRRQPSQLYHRGPNENERGNGVFCCDRATLGYNHTLPHWL